MQLMNSIIVIPLKAAFLKYGGKRRDFTSRKARAVFREIADKKLFLSFQLFRQICVCVLKRAPPLPIPV